MLASAAYIAIISHTEDAFEAWKCMMHVSDDRYCITMTIMIAGPTWCWIKSVGSLGFKLALPHQVRRECVFLSLIWSYIQEVFYSVSLLLQITMCTGHRPIFLSALSIMIPCIFISFCASAKLEWKFYVKGLDIFFSTHTGADFYTPPAFLLWVFCPSLSVFVVFCFVPSIPPL